MSPANPRRSALAGPRPGPCLASAGGLLVLTIAACAHTGAGQAGAPAPSPAAPVTSGPPPVPRPVADEPCGYLSAESVQIANGQRVTGVRVSATGPGQPYPACFFLTYHGAVQLRTWIVVATPAVARATLDSMAPQATSDLAELPGGWTGGAQPTAEGAVFAVIRRGTAVVITTNQRQTIGARRIAEQVITALGL
ncbi:MAG TPA: DUF2020 domain-containing protein [Pseudonocardiaceae bacterium]|nr:DUF2020 domain-containing protein [Pseudonocardiaceae bacterium]